MNDQVIKTPGKKTNVNVGDMYDLDTINFRKQFVEDSNRGICFLANCIDISTTHNKQRGEKPFYFLDEYMPTKVSTAIIIKKFPSLSKSENIYQIFINGETRYIYDEYLRFSKKIRKNKISMRKINEKENVNERKRK